MLFKINNVPVTLEVQALYKIINRETIMTLRLIISDNTSLQ